MHDIEALVRQMSLEEKAALCSGATPWTTKPLARLGVDSITVSDGPHGLRRPIEQADMIGRSIPATCFPTASALACSWDRDLLREVGEALGVEARALGVHVLLAPGVNMKRTPLCGRNFEYYSEDPYLAGELASAYVEGVQSTGVGTCLKHFAANNQESERLSISAEIPERVLREIYLAAFERVVTQARPWSVMCSYNRINGTYASQHRHLLTEILRDEWGFEGAVISDWGAVDDRVAGIEAGLDLEMPGPSPCNDRRIVEAVRSGRLDEQALDRAVTRILALVERALAQPGARDPARGLQAPEVEAHHRLARRAAARCMVLLKNDGGVLPLDPARLRSVAVLGHMAVAPQFQGGGSSRVQPTRVDVPLDELRAAAGSVALTYYQGYLESGEPDDALLRSAARAAEAADAALIFAGLPDGVESEGYDRLDMELPPGHVALIQAVAAVQPRTVVVLHNGAPVSMAGWIDRVPAVLLAGLAGQASGGAVADILFGRVNPSGKLAETYPVRLEDNPSYLNFPGENGKVFYGEGLFIGYRYYEARGVQPLFPFGHGLSYTTFSYGQASLSRPSIAPGDSLEVQVPVTNTGSRDGEEIVQLYVRPHRSQLPRPVKELKGFARVALAPGETRPASFRLTIRDFSYYDPERGGWVAEPGTYDLLIGASSQDIRVQATVVLTGGVLADTRLTAESSIQAWLDDPRGREALERFVPDEVMRRYREQPAVMRRVLRNYPLKKLPHVTGGRVDEATVQHILQSVTR
ncbi:glycoside hydrolase family 3 C-terminal domain-containing protein [Carboxydochorda subterranea]|uniref:Glycoside hydrolase family 3 C-terminal domain-containing protein n=1 Tax=Carboxydichorda subterranea TaxID=3109565 RepID=A0ABZ1BXK4_9FIRM|nr:glycoside hydrolase family 3 C-terminal domain-containing protein [Limnochorda sp. L945t]WRP17544.1 glycoside hydrolase family 3 C-terminal domain-containing protein [Limnochorda sp. L945t]